jgi:hypothetical protein
MKLIIDDKNGQYRYSGMANPEDIRDAKRLYNQWKTAIPKIERDLIAEGLLPEDPSATVSNGNETWWEFGSRLGEVIDNYQVIKLTTNTRVWDAVRVHLSKRFEKKVRDEKTPKRDHLRNCYRLSKLPREQVMKIAWSEWSEWLDSKFLSFNRADKWLNQNIDKIAMLNRKDFRAMAMFFRNNVAKKGKIEFGIFSDEEFNSLWDDKLNEFLTSLDKGE